MSEISFTSTITPVKMSEFSKISASISRDNFVDYPWNMSASRIGKDVVTDYICNCTACLITDGKKAMLKHLLPTDPKNHNEQRIENFILNHFNLPDKNVQAVLVGSNPEKESQNIFNIFIRFFNKFKVPVTILKTGKAPTNLAYKTSTDEVYVSNKYIDLCLKAGRSNENALKTGFEEVKVADCDEIKQ